MNYPRFSDEPVDGYHPGEEQPAMHNDEPQKPVTIPASDGLIEQITDVIDNHLKDDFDARSIFHRSVVREAVILAMPLFSANVETGQVLRLWQELLEKDDRTSPAEYPDMALITFDEFNALARTAADGTVDRAPITDAVAWQQERDEVRSSIVAVLEEVRTLRALLEGDSQ